MVHNLLIIGDAASKLTTEFRKNHGEIAWARIVAMRNIIVHEYFEVDPLDVGRVVESDLPELK